MKKYPKLTFITNVKIEGIEIEKPIIYFQNSEELIIELKKINLNENYGYLIFIDEIHVVLAELYGRTDPIFLQFLSQQRKLSIHIIATSQMFNYLMKPVRKYLIQSGQIIMCKKVFNVIQINKHIVMDTVEEQNNGTFTYKRAKLKWYIHTKELYECYDTFAVISQIQGLMKGELRYNASYDTNDNGTIQ